MPPLNRQVEIADSIADERHNLGPEERRIAFSNIGRALETESLVHADLCELMIERVELARVERVSELADQICSSDQARLRAPSFQRAPTAPA